MPKPRVLLTLALLSLFTITCGLLTSPAATGTASATQDVGQIVQGTFQALTAQAKPSPSATAQPATPSPQTASIAGMLNYPAEGLPAMQIVAYQVGTHNYKFVVTKAGQTTYQIDGLGPGTYHVVAYTTGGGGFPEGLAGGYTQAVPCGLSVTCTDHSLIDVTLTTGQNATGINPSDWYPPAGTFPALPQQAGAPAAGTPGVPPAVAGGSITGHLMYPSSAIPALRIVALQVGGSAYYYVDTAFGQSSYELDHVPPGTYHVVAYTLPGGGFNGGLAGGYSQMVPCGLAAGCNDHTLIDVVVTAGNTTAGVDPNDYYADPGSFPPNPSP